MIVGVRKIMKHVFDLAKVEGLSIHLIIFMHKRNVMSEA